MKNLILIVFLIIMGISCESPAKPKLDVYGCTDDTACNYNPDTDISNDSCIYSELNYDCDGNCTLELDCLSVCGGDAVIDECGVCEGDSASCSCEGVDCTYLDTQCVTGSCENGECITIYSQSGSVCDDGNFCTIFDSCDGQGFCESGALISCDDGNICTDDSCDVDGSCINTPNTFACDDGDACTSGDVCNGGFCESGALISCDDGNPCSEDSCDGLGGCTYDYTSNNGIMCDDGDECTESDVCNEGQCSGSVIPDCP